MFKWPGTPSARAAEHELADFAELLCWQRAGTSVTELARLVGRLEENEYVGGVPEEEETTAVVEAAYSEIERRKEACGEGYPFAVAKGGYTLRLSEDAACTRGLVYRYLLLATRLNMSSNRVHAGIDGALLFEELAAETARRYMGDRAEYRVFGTAAGTANFGERIESLCSDIKEGDGYMNRDEAPPLEKDGKLDLVVWKPFADGLPGKLMAFGQCKTGTNYKDTLAQLQPDAFCRKWLESMPVLTPLRMFFVSEALPRCRWRAVAVDAGLLLDRCRIVDFYDETSEEVLRRVSTWTETAAIAVELSVGDGRDQD